MMTFLASLRFLSFRDILRNKLFFSGLNDRHVPVVNLILEV